MCLLLSPFLLDLSITGKNDSFTSLLLVGMVPVVMVTEGSGGLR